MLCYADECSAKLVEPVLKSQDRKIAGGCLAKVLCHGGDLAVEMAQVARVSLPSLSAVDRSSYCLFEVSDMHILRIYRYIYKFMDGVYIEEWEATDMG